MARDLSSWLPGLIGPVEILQDGETVHAPRSKWDFQGATVTDNAAQDTVEIEFLPPFAEVAGAVPVETGATPAARTSRRLRVTELDYGAVSLTGPDTHDCDGTEEFILADLTAGDVEVTLPEDPRFGQPITFKIAPGTGDGAYSLVITPFAEFVEQFVDSVYGGPAPPSPPPDGFEPSLTIGEDAATVTLRFDGDNWVIV